MFKVIGENKREIAGNLSLVLFSNLDYIHKMCKSLFPLYIFFVVPWEMSIRSFLFSTEKAPDYNFHNEEGFSLGKGYTLPRPQRENISGINLKYSYFARHFHKLLLACFLSFLKTIFVNELGRTGFINRWESYMEKYSTTLLT